MSEKGGVSESQRRATEKYLQKLEEIKVRVPRGDKEAIQAHAEAHGESANGFINRAISETIEMDKAAPGTQVAILSMDIQQAAQTAAQATGETVPEFIARAVETQAQRDRLTRGLATKKKAGE